MGLRAGDLRDLIKPVFEVDSYKSKMGDDSDIVVVSFSVKEQQAAKDLVDFIEKGYGFVLDADSTPGEIDNGMYKVFVEMERDRHTNENIVELLDGVQKLSALDKIRFRYYKSFASKEATLENLNSLIPTSRDGYIDFVSESRIDNYKEFFSKSYLESSEVFGDELIIKKAYADPVGFKIKDFGKIMSINESIKDKININDYAEILFLTKYIGDYNITKFGSNTLMFENKGYALVLERL